MAEWAVRWSRGLLTLLNRGERLERARKSVSGANRSLFQQWSLTLGFARVCRNHDLIGPAFRAQRACIDVAAGFSDIGHAELPQIFCEFTDRLSPPQLPRFGDAPC